MKKIVKNNFPFVVPFIILWVMLAFVLLVNSKSDIHLFTNQFHSSFFDVFFSLITFLGDGLTAAIVAIFFLFISFRKGLILGLSALLAGVFSQFLKRVVFSGTVRPKVFFEGVSELYFVPHVEVHGFFSFPSGHATTAFCLFFILASFVQNRILKFICLLLALITAYSRIYLSQHFLVDVYFGALLGLLSAFISLLIINKVHATWLDKSLITIFKAE
jgi:membrane-associated phospholipid phosphatase